MNKIKNRKLLLIINFNVNGWNINKKGCRKWEWYQQCGWIMCHYFPPQQQQFGVHSRTKIPCGIQHHMSIGPGGFDPPVLGNGHKDLGFVCEPFTWPWIRLQVLSALVWKLLGKTFFDTCGIPCVVQVLQYKSSNTALKQGVKTENTATTTRKHVWTHWNG